MNNEQYINDLSLLRPFELEAAKNGAEVVSLFRIDDPGVFICEDTHGMICIKREDIGLSLWNKTDVGSLRMKPLTWIEGKPVYKGDVLYSKICPEYLYITKSVEGDLLYTEENVTAAFCECIKQLTWNKPKQKVKRKIWINVYPDGTSSFDSEYMADLNSYPSRIACVETEIEYEV